jgi:hypothetical protein
MVAPVTGHAGALFVSASIVCMDPAPYSQLAKNRKARIIKLIGRHARRFERFGRRPSPISLSIIGCLGSTSYAALSAFPALGPSWRCALGTHGIRSKTGNAIMVNPAAFQ